MRRLAVTAAAAALAVSTAGARQGQSPPPRTVFRSSIDLVHLDVSVLDADRRPVRGLGPADFTVLEDGKPQKIAVFNAVHIPATTFTSAREANLLVDVPVAQLAAGEYLLTVEAASGSATATRTSRFHVVR